MEPVHFETAASTRGDFTQMTAYVNRIGVGATRIASVIAGRESDMLACDIAYSARPKKIRPGGCGEVEADVIADPVLRSPRSAALAREMRRVLGYLVACLVVLVAPAASAQTSPRRVAVLDFANTAKDPSAEWLGPAVAETLTTKLHAIRALHMVERAQLYKVLQEQKLNLTDLVDPSQAVRVGKLLGAEQVVLGAYVIFGGTVRFTARFVDVTTGTIVATSQVNGLLDPRNPNGLWTALDQLAQAAVDSVNTRVAIVQGLPQPVPVPPAQRIEPRPEEQARLARAPTASLEALEAYGRGQAAYKRHQWARAETEFQRATVLDPDYPNAWNSLGRVRNDLGKYSEALQAFERAHQLSARLGDEPGMAWTLNAIGIAHERQGRYAEALSHFERSLRLKEKLGDEPGRAATLNGIGNVHQAQGRYAEALSHYERSLRLMEKLGDAPGIARTLTNIGIVHWAQGRYAEALSHYERSLRLEEKLGDEPGMAHTLNNIGGVHERQGRYPEALSHFERSLRLEEKLGDERGIAGTLNNIGNVHAKQGRYAEALSHHERSLRLEEKLGNERGMVISRLSIAVNRRSTRDLQGALEAIEGALVIAERLGMAEADQIRLLRDRIRSEMR